MPQLQFKSSKKKKITIQNLYNTCFLYLDEVPKKPYGFHRECYSSYTHKRDLERLQNKRTAEPDDIQSPPRKSARVPTLSS